MVASLLDPLHQKRKGDAVGVEAGLEALREIWVRPAGHLARSLGAAVAAAVVVHYFHGVVVAPLHSAHVIVGGCFCR